MKETAWGKIEMEIGTPAANGGMSESLESIGLLKEDTLSIEAADGTVLELYTSGHELRDELKGEPTITVKATIIEMPEAVRAKIWEIESVDTAGNPKYRVKSLVSNRKWSTRFASQVVGSETFEAPYCSMSMKPVFSEKEGWSAEVEFKLLRGQAGYLFDFGIVPEPSAPVTPLTVSPTTLSFPATADNTGKPVTVTTEGAVTASASESWCTTTVTGTTVKVKVSANSTAASRTAKVTIEAEGKSAVVEVTQEGTGSGS